MLKVGCVSVVYPDRSIAWDLELRFVTPSMKNLITDMSAMVGNAQV